MTAQVRQRFDALKQKKYESEQVDTVLDGGRPFLVAFWGQQPLYRRVADILTLGLRTSHSWQHAPQLGNYAAGQQKGLWNVHGRL